MSQGGQAGQSTCPADKACQLHVELTEADLAELDAAAPLGVAAGSRYPEAQIAVIGR